MPTFEFKCDAGHITTKHFSMTDTIPARVVCDVCGKDAARIWTNANIFIPENMRAVKTGNS